MSEHTTSFVMSQWFDDVLIAKANAKKKEILMDYMSGTVSWSDNDDRFTSHDMRRYAVQYFDTMIQSILSDAQMAISIAQQNWSDEWLYKSQFSHLERKRELLKQFI